MLHIAYKITYPFRTAVVVSVPPARPGKYAPRAAGYYVIRFPASLVLLCPASCLFRFTAVFPESRSYPIPVAYPGIGTLSLLRDSGQKRGHGVLPQPVISLSDGHSLVLVHR